MNITVVMPLNASERGVGVFYVPLPRCCWKPLPGIDGRHQLPFTIHRVSSASNPPPHSCTRIEEPPQSPSSSCFITPRSPFSHPYRPRPCLCLTIGAALVSHLDSYPARDQDPVIPVTQVELLSNNHSTAKPHTPSFHTVYRPICETHASRPQAHSFRAPPD